MTSCAPRLTKLDATSSVVNKVLGIGGISPSRYRAVATSSGVIMTLPSSKYSLLGF
eukprot:CAMPEP_0196817836 /NCGR_PEP_ID=MMETSP1362-20130617/62786_1 /TAXON_ID=163516 /ORGANISM="Leptocylindrus danicus, Strain CCMP1856" /LENGTH=55 /DNA_ID=CAMNT_0042195697 /DNA_START=83 /DNA_END=247 /DNA_ORIENTATION=-